ncbi:MAG: GcrA family cell cycle regulator [Beijerinckiaceae bacterium]
MSWTEERVELLRKLWLDGFSASQIASQLANGISRNAVIGKVHRLGLAGRAKAPNPMGQRPRVKPARPAVPRPAAAATRGNTAFALRLQPMPIARPQPVDEVVVPICEPVTIMELREAMCRWPLGDPTTAEFRFCGAKKGASGTGSYCAYHGRLAYQPLNERRRERERERRLHSSA